MLSNNIIDICYARISTNSKHQRSSLENQQIALKKLRGENTTVIHSIHSGELDFPNELKNKILEEKQKNNQIRLNIFAFDRLTRNLRDLDFVYQNVKYLYVIGTNREYDVQNELKEITINIVNAIQELSINRNRANLHANYNKISGIKRPRDTETEKEHEQIHNFHKECSSMSENLKNNGVPISIVKQVEEFIRFSQNLSTISQWNEFFTLATKIGLDSEKLKKNYKKYINEYKNKTEGPHYSISKNDLVEFTNDTFRKYNFSNNAFANKFVNCNIKITE